MTKGIHNNQPMSQSSEFKIKITDIPLGSWDVYGNWYPNLRLKMSAANQRRHNMIGGHFKNLPARQFVTLFIDASPPTLMEKIRTFLSKI